MSWARAMGALWFAAVRLGRRTKRFGGRGRRINPGPGGSAAMGGVRDTQREDI